MVWGILGFLLLAGAVTDVRTRTVPNWVSCSVIALGGLMMILDFQAILGHLTGGLCAFLLLGVPAMLGKGIGGGDVKLALGLGLFWGFPDILTLLLSAFALSLLFWGVARLLGKMLHATIPLVPFLCAGHILFGVMAF